MITTSIYREYWEEPTSAVTRRSLLKVEQRSYDTLRWFLGNVPYPPAFKRESPLSE